MTLSDAVIALGAAELVALVAVLAAMVGRWRAPLRLHVPPRPEPARSSVQEAA
jgi:hypothetical protein